MEVLMSRLTRHRTSRTVVSITVIAIAIGAAVEFKRSRPSVAGTTPPPLGMSISQPAAPPVPVKPPAAPVAAAAPTPVIKPLVTTTPDPLHPGQSNGALFSTAQLSNARLTGTSPVAPAQPRPLSSAPVAANSAQTTAAPAELIADAQAKLAEGDLIAARASFNSALLSNKLTAIEIDAVKKQMAQINQTLVFSPKQFPKDPLGGVYTVKSGDRLAAIGNAHCVPFELLLSLNHMTDAKKLRYGQLLKVINGPFHAIVSKSKFTLDVYLGSPGGSDSTYITTFMVGLGTDNSTPTGTWTIRNKVTHPAYFPPADHPGPTLLPDDPKNPLGPYWMGLEGTDGQAVGQQSYGIHGTIDPTSIGKQSSMGCIRLKNEDVEVVYKLLMAGKSTVIVRD
jgi:LysM repeat protein